MAVLLSIAAPALAVDVNVIGLFPGKAVVVVDRGAPRTLSVGQRSPEGVLLLAADSQSATLEIDGRRETLQLGQHVESPALSGTRASVTLPADGSGHFSAEGRVNGGRVRFLVDTGATLVSLPASDARRLGIDYRKGQPVVIQTAIGHAAAYRVRLDSVAVGTVTLYGVDALVHESAGAGVALLGMSFLNRMEMRHEGENLILTKRY